MDCKISQFSVDLLLLVIRKLMAKKMFFTDSINASQLMTPTIFSQ